MSDALAQDSFTHRPDFDLIILEHIDPKSLAGGIDTSIALLSKFGIGCLGIVGVTENPTAALGVWTRVLVSGVYVWFMPVATLDKRRANGPAKYLPHSLQFAAGLIRFRSRYSAPCYHVHRVEIGVLLSLMRRSYVQFIHNDGVALVGAASDSRWKRFAWIYRILERVSLLRARAVGLFNKTDVSRLRRTRPDVQVMETGYDPQVFFTAEGPIESPARLSIAWVGRLESQKDPLLAVSVADEIDKLEIPFSLTMIGSGSLEGALREKIQQLGLEERVSLVGQLDSREVADTLRSSSCLLMTSHYEGSPTVLIESLACGCPVIGTAGSDPDGLLSDGGVGEALGSREASELARAVVNDTPTFDSANCAQSVTHRSGAEIAKRMMKMGRQGQDYG